MDNLLSGLIGALLGSLVGGIVTVWATNRMIQHEFDKREQDTRDQVDAFLKAIHTEIKSLLNVYMNRVGYVLQEQVGKPFLYYWPIKQDYFTVYSTNCQLIGLVNKPDVRELIVVTYVSAKGLLDTYNYNNYLLEEFKKMKLDNIAENGLAPKVSDKQLKEKEAELTEYAIVMMRAHVEMVENSKRLIGVLVEDEKIRSLKK